MTFICLTSSHFVISLCTGLLHLDDSTTLEKTDDISFLTLHKGHNYIHTKYSHASRNLDSTNSQGVEGGGEWKTKGVGGMVAVPGGSPPQDESKKHFTSHFPELVSFPVFYSLSWSITFPALHDGVFPWAVH